MMKLGDICSFQSGGTPSRSNSKYFNGTIPWITTVALTGGVIDENSAVEFISDDAIRQSAAKIVKPYSIMVGTRVGVGKVAINSVAMSTSQDVVSLIDIDETKWNKMFLVKFIQAKNNFLNSQARGATIKGIKIEVLAELELPDIDLPTQRWIADTLDKVAEEIGLCRKMLGKLDLMVKAKFVEMFGDVVQNSKQLPIKTLPEISEDLDSRRIPITGSVREKGIYPYYGASGIVDYVKDYLFDEDILLISEDGANLLARSTPIAFSAAGKVWVNNHAHVLRFRDRATQCYVENFLNMIDISNYVTGTAQPKLNQAKLNAIPIPTPELASQKQFMEFTRQIEKIKLTSCEVLDKMETERLALMQEYFK